jgi:hypothetical protein
VTREELARMVIEALDARRRYFAQHSRSEAQFEAMVALEKRLRAEAERILNPDTANDEE